MSGNNKQRYDILKFGDKYPEGRTLDGGGPSMEGTFRCHPETARIHGNAPAVEKTDMLVNVITTDPEETEAVTR